MTAPEDRIIDTTKDLLEMSPPDQEGHCEIVNVYDAFKLPPKIIDRVLQQFPAKYKPHREDDRA